MWPGNSYTGGTNTYTYPHTMENGVRQRPVEPIPEDRQRGRLDLNVFFDVLDTLLSEEDIPRLHAREVFQELKERGHDVYLWSRACYELWAGSIGSGCRGGGR